MAIIRVSGTCDSGSTPDRTTFLFFGNFFSKDFQTFISALKNYVQAYNSKIKSF